MTGFGTGFGARLVETVAARGPLCVGVDPHGSLLQDWGLGDDVDGLSRFADICAEAFAETASVIKPQSAFFERFGSAGVAVLERLIAACHAGGAIVLLDVKRGDIGSTMDAYAQAYLDPSSSIAVDAITASPYLGVGALEPAFALAAKQGNGVFVLALTSNPDGAPVQHPVAQGIVDAVAARNGGALPLGDFGLVIGATVGELAVDIGAFDGPILVPGVGAQGGTPEDIRRLFGAGRRGVLPAVSRGVLRSGPAVPALRAAAARYTEDLAFLVG